MKETIIITENEYLGGLVKTICCQANLITELSNKLKILENNELVNKIHKIKNCQNNSKQETLWNKKVGFQEIQDKAHLLFKSEDVKKSLIDLIDVYNNWDTTMFQSFEDLLIYVYGKEMLEKYIQNKP